ncbi:hypothetical protein ACE02D_07905 [Shewanella bicestrii]
MEQELLQQFEYETERWIFRAGLQQYSEARRVAQLCPRFTPDDEDEQVDDELRSCYNCQYRRWMMTSFECLMLKNTVLLNN